MQVQTVLALAAIDEELGYLRSVDCGTVTELLHAGVAELCGVYGSAMGCGDRRSEAQGADGRLRIGHAEELAYERRGGVDEAVKGAARGLYD